MSGSRQLPISTSLPSGYLGISQSPVPNTNSLPRGGVSSGSSEGSGLVVVQRGVVYQPLIGRNYWD